MDNKIAFITCVNDEILYSKCLWHINALTVPDGYCCEIIAIRGAKSMTSGYNQAMGNSDAKYKVYLHQDTYIINKSFIADILHIFKNNSHIGLMGVIGAEKLPASGIWSASKYKYGKVLESSDTPNNEIAPFKANDFDEDYKIIRAVDGLIIITQYDILWREDILDGWDFYDISQCMEFYRKNYQVCTPKQHDFWCIHDCGKASLANYDKYRHIFLNEYSSELYPLGKLMPKLHDWKEQLRSYIKRIEKVVKKLRKKKSK